MFRARRDYRKKFNASGQILIGGEVLNLHCHDVSVKGAMFYVAPGQFLGGIEDFAALLEEDVLAEIFIKDLSMVSTVKVIWAKLINEEIQLGVEFQNLQTKAEKLWMRRRNYRKKHFFAVELFIEKDRLNVDGMNLSLEGMCLRTEIHHPLLKVDTLVKVQIHQYATQAIGKIVWLKEEKSKEQKGVVTFGLSVIPVS